ncbi:dehydrodolichyl diphosphate syntase complex subunit SPAC4D7.04c, partial [Penicillium frequentans]
MPLPNLKKTISSSNWTQKIATSVLEQGPIPKHIAFIMDGNRRFSRRHGIEIKEGHLLGGVALERATCYDVGVETVTVYAFSIENFKRPTEQVDAIWSILREMTKIDSTLRALLRSCGARLGVLGRLDLLPEDVRESIEEMVDDAQNRTQKVFNVCVAYTSQDEMTRAVRRSVTDYYQARTTGRLSSDQYITSEMLTDRMDTAKDLPVDLLVRTSGVYRLSDFLLWQCHQDTDIQIMDILWPDLEFYDLWVVILRWQRKAIAR